MLLRLLSLDPKVTVNLLLTCRHHYTLKWLLKSLHQLSFLIYKEFQPNMVLSHLSVKVALTAFVSSTT